MIVFLLRDKDSDFIGADQTGWYIYILFCNIKDECSAIDNTSNVIDTIIGMMSNV